jgi:hypothetical protein
MQTLAARQRSMLTPTLQEREQSVDAVITAYTARLKERTRHHLGCVLREQYRVDVCRLTGMHLPRSYPYNLDFDFGPLEGLLKCAQRCAGRCQR